MRSRYLRCPSVWAAAVLAVQMPLGVTVPSDSSRVTESLPYSSDPLETVEASDRASSSVRDGPGTTIRLGGGGGSYMTFLRDCEGRKLESARHSFGDVAVEVNHRFRNGAETGVRGGYVDNDFIYDELSTGGWHYGAPSEPFAQRGVYYVNPYIGPETRLFGLGVGVIWASDPLIRTPGEDEPGWVVTDAGDSFYPSGHLRIGPRSAHFSLRVLEGFPVCSGGGIVDTGVGWRTDHVRGWAGLSLGGVYDGFGGLLNLSVDVSDRLEFGTNVRIGLSESEAEYGGGLVLGWRLGR